MPKLIKSLASFGAKVFKGSAKLTGNLLKKLGGTIKNLLVRTAKALGSYDSGTFKNLRGLAGGAGASATRATGVQQRRLTGAGGGASPGARPKLRQLPKPGVPKPTSPSTLANAERLFKPGGLKHFKKVSGIFKKVPFIGALIGIGIDLAMGERLDNAIAGAAGASLGAAIGGAIGTAVLPIPFVGTFLGGTVGAAVGDWAGKEIYKKLSGQITQINPPVESGFSDKLQRRLDSPLPPDVPASSGSGGGSKYQELASMVVKGEGGLNSVNRGTAGDTPGGSKSIFGKNLSEMTVGEIMQAQKEGKVRAVGKYQFIPGTLAGAVSYTKTPLNAKFNSATQNKLFDYLIDVKRPEIGAYINGKSNDRRTAVQQLAREFASVGLEYPENGKKRGQSRYAGTGGNRASISPELAGSTLDKQRGIGPQNPPQAPVLPGPDGKMPTQASPTTPLIGAGNATFGSTGRVSNAPNWVHGHFQDNNKNALLNNTFLVVKRLLEQGVSVVITGGPGEEQLNRNMSDSRIRSAISKGIDRHSNRTRGYFAVDVSVPKGTKVPVPLQDIRSGGNEGISGLIPGTNTFIGHLAPGSKSATAAELAQSLRRQASYDQRGGTIVVPAPVISGGGGQTMPSGGGGGVLPVGMLQKDVLNSYYRAQLLGFLYKQG
jgi:hypothetical protein